MIIPITKGKNFDPKKTIYYNGDGFLTQDVDEAISDSGLTVLLNKDGELAFGPHFPVYVDSVYKTYAVIKGEGGKLSMCRF